MIRIGTTQLWVHDQDAALEFWTKQVGFELRTDASFPDMGDFRWLTVGPAGQPDIEIVLMAVPGAPVMDESTRQEVLSLVGKGFAGTVFLVTDDIQRDYEELAARGVEFQGPPEDRPYGIDTGFSDPSGNQIRIAQLPD